MAEKVNLNTASSDELDRIANIGQECAQRIVSEREQRAGFGDDAIPNFKEDAFI